MENCRRSSLVSRSFAAGAKADDLEERAAHRSCGTLMGLPLLTRARSRPTSTPR